MTAQGPHHRRTATCDVVLVVTGMSCRHCVRQVTACLRDVPGVETVEADRVSCQVRLRGCFALPEVLSALARSGHQARVLGDSTAGPPPSLEEEEQ